MSTNNENNENYTETKIITKNKVIFIISIVIPIVIAILSFTLLSKSIRTSNLNDYTINQLQERQETILKISAAATVVAVTTSLIPQTEQISDKIFDLTKYFIIILFAIVLEKYMFAFMGVIIFQILIPISCIIFVIATIFNKIPFKILAIKLLIFALLSFSVVPVCVVTQEKIEKTNNEFSTKNIASDIENLKEQVKDLDEETLNKSIVDENKVSSEVETETIVKEETINTIEESIENGMNETESPKGFFAEIGAKIKNTVDGISKKTNNAVEEAKIAASNAVEEAKTAVSNVVNGAKTAVKEKINELTNKFNKLMEQIVILLVVNCAFPILVVLFYLWLFKRLFDVEIDKKFLEKFSGVIFSKNNERSY